MIKQSVEMGTKFCAALKGVTWFCRSKKPCVVWRWRSHTVEVCDGSTEFQGSQLRPQMNLCMSASWLACNCNVVLLICLIGKITCTLEVIKIVIHFYGWYQSVGLNWVACADFLLMRLARWSQSLNTSKRHMDMSFVTHSCHASKLAMTSDPTIFLWRCAKLWKVSDTQNAWMSGRLRLSWKSHANGLVNVRMIFCRCVSARLLPMAVLVVLSNQQTLHYFVLLTCQSPFNICNSYASV